MNKNIAHPKGGQPAGATAPVLPGCFSLGFLFLHMTPEQLKKWADALSEAAKLADDLATHPDDGTCNTDTVTIDFKGWRQSSINQLSALSGISFSNKLTSRFWKGNRFVWFDYRGYAGRRTAIAEACCKHLLSAGIPAVVYYQMD